MRPLKLTLSAFGPFTGEQIIDFRKLGDSPLFLINGPTGSGKTTILDAICYALYGKTTGGEREGQQMRCDHADADRLTEVVFDFELANNCYRIRRVPEQQRPRLKGEGFTEQKPEAQLYKLNEGVEAQVIVARKTGDATHKIEELTGLTADQFRQVIVLPQGKFRQLLLAESKDREQILSKLFETHLYQTIEERLKENAKEIADEVKALAQIETTLLETVEVESVEVLQEQIKEQIKRVTELEKSAKAGEEAYKKQQNARSDGEKLYKEFEIYNESNHSLEVILEKESSYKDNLKSHKKAVAAERLAATYQNRIDRKRERLNACRSYEKSCIQKEQAEESLKTAKQNWETAEQQKPQLEQFRQKQLELKSLLPRVDRLKQAELSLQKIEQQISENQQQLNTEEKAQQKNETDFIAEENSFKTQQSAVALLPVEEGRLEAASRLLTLNRTVNRQQAALLEAEKNRDDLKLAQKAQQKMAEQAKQQRSKIEINWHHGQAALLAKELDSDTPCPVCGSNEHPKLATSEIELPSEDDLRSARDAADSTAEKLRTLLSQLEQAEHNCDQCSEKIKELVSELGDQANVARDVIESRHAEADQKVTQLRKMGETLAQKEQQLKSLTEKLDHHQETLAATKKVGEALIGKGAAAHQDLENKKEELPQKYRAVAALETEIKELVNAQQTLEHKISEADRQHRQSRETVSRLEAQTTAAKEHVGQLEQAAEEAEKNWIAKCAISQFENENDFLEAKLLAEEVSALEVWLESYSTEKLQAETRLKESKQRIEGEVKPDLDALKLKEAETADAYKIASANYHQAVARQEQLTRASEKLSSSNKDKIKLEERYKTIGQLSKIANGDNAHNLSLQRFVLAVLLDDVLVAATQRLLIMSKGRYQLIRKTEVTHKGRKAGLDLDVADQYTGKARPVATLSGGESFMAALSLALGLSDVVQGYSGGIKLDMLFIDEGFGSLDSDSLELAIKTLVELQAVGRMVGVISHVSELKERMETRLDLTSNSGGSQIKLVVP